MSQKSKFVDNIGRKKWDLDEYQQKAKEKSAADAEKVSGKKSKGEMVVRSSLQARSFSVDLLEKVGKYEVITAATPLQQRGGFYCDVCDCLLKDSRTYLDHINGRPHQKALGMNMYVERVSVSQVKKKFEEFKKGEEEKRQTESVEERLARYEQQQKDKKKRKKHGGGGDDHYRGGHDNEYEDDYATRGIVPYSERRVDGNKKVKTAASEDVASAPAKSDHNVTVEDATNQDDGKEDDGSTAEERAEQEAMAAMGFSAFGTSSKKR